MTPWTAINDPGNHHEICDQCPPSQKLSANNSDNRPSSDGPTHNYNAMTYMDGSPNLYHAFNMVQNLGITSVPRWNDKTFERVIGAGNQLCERASIPTNTGTHSEASNQRHLAEWWRTTMINLINEQLQREGKPTLKSDDFMVLSGNEEK